MAYQMLITVDKKTLLSAMRMNRTQHREIFLEALEGYRAAAAAELTRELDTIRSARKPGSISLHIGRPEDHTRDYDRVIGMLEMHQGDTYTLDEHTYAKYVNDDWDWKDRWLKMSSAYSARASEMYEDDDD